MNKSFNFHKHLLFISSIFFLFSFQTKALNYYWTGGTGNWTDLNHWVTTTGGTTLHNQIPTAVDDVFFDANSFLTTGQTVTLDPLTILVHNITLTGVTNTPTFAGPPTNLLKIYGSITLATGMNLTFDGAVNFESTTAGKTISMAGRSFNSTVSFNGIGGVWTLLDAFATTGRIDLTSGVLNTNNKIVTSGDFFASTTAVKTLNMGSSIFNLTGTWKVDAATTINCGTSIINLTNGAFTGGDHTYYDLNFTDITSSVTGTIINGNNFHDVVFFSKAVISKACNFHNVSMLGDGEIHENNTFNDLTFSAGHAYSLENLATQTINGTFYANGNCGALIAINSFVQGSQAGISHPAGVVNGSFLVLKDMLANGGGNFTASSSVDLGNNTGWTIQPLTSQNLYWIGNSGNWDDGSHWSFTSGGTPSGCAPTPFDNVFFDASSFSIAGQVVLINPFIAYCNDMTWTSVTNTPTLSGPAPNLLKIYGSLRFVAGMMTSFEGLVNFEATTPGKTITMAGNSFREKVTFNGVDGGWTLLDEFTTSSNITLSNGVLTTNNQTVNASDFNSTTSQPRTLNMGTSVFNISGNNLCWAVTSTGITLNCGTSLVNCTNAASPNFSGGDLVYYDLNFTNLAATGNIVGNNIFHDVIFTSNAYIFQSNTFHNVTMLRDGVIQGGNQYNNLTFSAGHTYLLSEGTTQEINGMFNASGNCGALIDIHSTTAGNQAIISHPSGTVNISFVILKDISATGGANFNANSSVDLGNNTGWIVNPAPAQNLYWINNDGNWDDGAHWSFTSGGTPSGCSPTPLDHVFFDANSFSLAGQTVNINPFTAYCNDMTWTGVTNMPTLEGS
ncbi:MAG: hypothetical protein ABIT58_03420, partial [Ferruginibacter sp.]